MSIGQAAKELGVSQRPYAAGKRKGKSRWNAPRKVIVAMTWPNSTVWCHAHQQPTGQHLLMRECPAHDQKEDLVRQVALLETFCAANGWTLRDHPGSGFWAELQQERAYSSSSSGSALGRLDGWC